MGHDSLNFFVVNVPQFLASDKVQKLTFIEQGIYLRLLIEYWNGHCTGLCSTSVRFTQKSTRVLLGTFVEVDGLYHNPEAKRLWVAAYTKKQRLSDAGKRGGMAQARLKPGLSQASPPTSSLEQNHLLHHPSNTRKAKFVPCNKEEGPFFRKEEKKKKSNGLLDDPVSVIEWLRAEWPPDRFLGEREIRSALTLAARCCRHERCGKIQNAEAVFRAIVRRGDANLFFRGASKGDEALADTLFKEYFHESLESAKP